ncbi:methytransferase partner Trm112 [Archaeoglobus neptunius]|uniref:methytransferase partner Trm112 n=1 Tax=Archaeoglobus neptunius TaxID=2798580 RepID=UPI0019293E2D|nr:methytransferase partner Trm112 [Archaeoglobus neptunius]
MRRRLLEILECPICKSDLEVEVYEEDEEEIISGKVRCKQCKAEFPIENKILNMLPEELRK